MKIKEFRLKFCKIFQWFLIKIITYQMRSQGKKWGKNISKLSKEFSDTKKIIQDLC